MPASRASWKAFQRLRPLLAGSSAASATSVHGGEPGLAQLATTFASHRRTVRPLVLHTLGDQRLGVRLASLQHGAADRPLQVGDFVPHLSKTDTFCCVWTSPRNGFAEIVNFQPLRRCQKHAASGADHCYRKCVAANSECPDTYRREVPLTAQGMPVLTPQPLQNWPTADASAAAVLRLACDAVTGTTEPPALAGNGRVIFEDTAVTLLQCRAMPASCPRCTDDDSACVIRSRGKRFAAKFLSAQGVRLVRSTIYECKAHGFRYNLPIGTATTGTSLVGDVLGQWIVSGEVWPALWSAFQDSESYRAVQKAIRSSTETAVLQSSSQRQLRGSLSVLGLHQIFLPVEYIVAFSMPPQASQVKSTHSAVSCASAPASGAALLSVP